jgi:ATP/maltotriose-dependent transcriptional regulator MalT
VRARLAQVVIGLRSLDAGSRLRGLAAGLSRREIGAQLYTSLNTVKSHTRELYRKLGARSQAEAVARAEALGLLEPGQSPG